MATRAADRSDREKTEEAVRTAGRTEITKAEREEDRTNRERIHGITRIVAAVVAGSIAIMMEVAGNRIKDERIPTRKRMNGSPVTETAEAAGVIEMMVAAEDRIKGEKIRSQVIVIEEVVGTIATATEAVEDHIRSGKTRRGTLKRRLMIGRRVTRPTEKVTGVVTAVTIADRIRSGKTRLGTPERRLMIGRRVTRPTEIVTGIVTAIMIADRTRSGTMHSARNRGRSLIEEAAAIVNSNRGVTILAETSARG